MSDTTLYVATFAQLNAAIQQADQDTTSGTSYTIVLTANITETADLSALNLHSGVGVTIDGGGFTLDGNSEYRGLVVYAGDVALQDLTIADAHAVGGAGGAGGGGGGAGLGGGLLVGSGGTVTLSGVDFTNDAATGGAGGSGAGGNSDAGGGGGLGGDGAAGTPATHAGGGGGVGNSATGGQNEGAGSVGTVPGAAGGGTSDAGGAGGASGGGGGGGNTRGGGGGGIGGGNAGRYTAGHGGWGGGGGGSGVFGTAGEGGFGGGGGGGYSYGGAGGFGGGGGGGESAGGGGFGAGNGGPSGGGGGGGLGAGGDIFVETGGSLTIEGGSLSAGTVNPGSAGAEPTGGTVYAAQSGSAYGSAIFLQATVTLAPASGQTLTIAGTIADQTGSGGTGATAESAGLVIDGAGTVDLSAANTFTGGTTLEAGTLVLGAAQAAGSGDVVFENDPTLAFTIADAPTNTIDGFSPGDTIDITDLTTTATHATLDTSDDVLSIPYTNAGGGTLTLQLNPDGDYTDDVFNLVAATTPLTGTLLTLQATCFCRGTLILTDRGDIAVEDLRIGDHVVTHSGDLRPIRWIGRRGYSGAFAAGKPGILPVRIARSALQDDVPKRDLLVSPQHAMLIDGMLVPAVALLNGRSITQAETVDRLDYYHIELDSHDVILAEGAPSESFVDDDSRSMFDNAADYATLYPDALPKPACYCAPRVEDGDAIEGLRHRLAARTGAALAAVARADAADTAEPPMLRGYLDTATRTQISGWAWIPGHPDEPLALEVLDNGEVIARVLANRYRADLAAAGIGGGRHGFELTIPDGLSPLIRHVITVRIAGGGAMLENVPATIEPAARFDDGLAHAVADAVIALDEPVEQDRVLSFLAAQMDRLLQHRANTAAQRDARHAHRLFRRRWGPDAVTPDPGVFSDAGLRALVIDDEVPTLDRDAGSQAILSHMLALRTLGYGVSFVAAQQFSENATPTGNTEGIAALERDAITCCRLPAYASVEEVLRRQAGCFDLIYLHRLSNAAKYLALARQHSPRARVVYSVADLHHLRLERQARIEERSDLLAESHRVRLVECMAALSADTVLTHSVHEAMLLRRVVPGANVHVVPWIVASDRTVADDTSCDDQRRNGVAFIANFAHEPNVDAARFLAETIMPLVWRQDPTITCLLVGSRMPETIRRLARSGPSMALLALGHVPDLAPVFDRVRLTVAPLRYGAGVKGKVLASFAAGVPCAMSAIAAEGIELPPELSACVGGSPAELADLIVRLHADAPLRHAVGRAGLALIETSFNASHVAASLKTAIDSRKSSAQFAATPTQHAAAE